VGRLVNSYARDLRRLKGGRNEVFAATIAGLLLSAAVTGTLIHMSHPNGFLAWLKILGSYVYWFEFKRVSLETVSALSRVERAEFGVFLRLWESRSSWNEIYQWTSIGTLALVVLGWTLVRSRNSARAKMSEQLREGEQVLVEPKALQKMIRTMVKDKSRPHQFRPSDIVFGKEGIRVCEETIGLHLGIGGASQTGKTNVINHLLASRREVGEKVLIVDPNGEFYARFGRPGDAVLSLHDRRALKWDFWSEGVSEEELAKALVEVRDGMDASTKFFQTTGRAVLTSLLRIAKKSPHRLRELWRLANLPAEELEAVLRANNEISHRYLGQGDSGQASGVIATSLMNLEFLKYLNHHVTQRESVLETEFVPFSIRDWVLKDSDSRWVFLVASDSHWEQTRPLMRLWFDIASTAILERTTGRSGALSPLWLVCDELSTVGLLPSLPKVLDRGYKYRGRLVLGFQSLAQIQQIYGQDPSANIMQGLQNVLVFACNETKLAREFSERLGRSEVEEYESTVSPAEGKTPMRISISSRQREHVSVTPDEIRGLPENVAYLKLARLPPTRLQFPYGHFPDSGARSRDFSEIPVRTWLDQDVTLDVPKPADATSKERNKSAKWNAPKSEKVKTKPVEEVYAESPSKKLKPSPPKWGY
jgi:type IV secretory pathway TraG/TraD family ATPase VirD4